MGELGFIKGLRIVFIRCDVLAKTALQEAFVDSVKSFMKDIGFDLEAGEFEYESGLKEIFDEYYELIEEQVEVSEPDEPIHNEGYD